jgi:hypothetical protein
MAESNTPATNAIPATASSPEAFLGGIGVLAMKLPRPLDRSLGRAAHFAFRALRAVGDLVDGVVRFCREPFRRRVLLSVGRRHARLL